MPTKQDIKKEILEQIDVALQEYEALSKNAVQEDYSDQPEDVALMVTNRLASTIDRLAPSGSHHKRNLETVLAQKDHAYSHLKQLKGALSALRREYELDYLQSFAELVRADTFASFLEMASHLHDQEYKDAAAVIAGSVLEQHLRELCNKNSIAVVDANGKSKKADSLNTELAGQGVYSKLNQKDVTAWLGLRNEAAHGNYGAYTAAQVRLMIDAVTNFMARYPA
jgi:hypothetical protein